MNEQLKKEQRETAFVLVDSIASKMVTKKTFWVGLFVCSFLSACWGGAWVYYLGPNIGVIGVEGDSYAYLTQENARLNAENEREAKENTRLNDENERLFRKNQQHSETLKATEGFMLNCSDNLKLATRINTLRQDGFPFKNWHPSFAEKAIAMCLRAGHDKALQWVTEQPNWFSILSEETVLEVRAAVEANKSLLADKL